MATTYRINNDKIEIYQGEEKVGQCGISLLQYDDGREALERLAVDAMSHYMGWEAYEACQGRGSLPTPAEVADTLLVARDQLLELGLLSAATREEEARAGDEAMRELFDAK